MYAALASLVALPGIKVPGTDLNLKGDAPGLHLGIRPDSTANFKLETACFAATQLPPDNMLEKP